MSKPLRASDIIPTERGRITADAIIGKRVRDTIRTGKGFEYRIHEPSLGEYTDLSPRLVTPIYSQDTNLIVSLLDLHPSNPGADDRGAHDRLEIFEAGTGHGALTLNLARAIHGANGAAPEIPGINEDHQNDHAGLQAKEVQDTYDAWRGKRRAVIHTVDKSAAYSRHAQSIVRDFRQGMYFPNIDFHVGSIQDFLSQRSRTPFLDHAILDLPDTHHQFDSIGNALKSDGSLVTWCPSITQINRCVVLVKEDNMPFLLERVIEVGAGLNGGREWDVRMVKPRALASNLKDQATESASDEDVVRITGESREDVSGVKVPFDPDRGWEMVCRPKVGIRITGGGFIALWRKMERHKL